MYVCGGNRISYEIILRESFCRCHQILFLVGYPGGPIPSGCWFGYIGTTEGLSFFDMNFAPDFTQTPPVAVNPFQNFGMYPGVVAYFQQRKVFGATLNGPQTIWMTQPGDYSNMCTSNPSRASDAITLTIAANQVNTIRQFVPVKALLVMTEGGAWKLDGGSSGAAITPSSVSVLPQSYTGCADLPPIVINNDILYVQSKGSIVRDLSYNIYADVFTGADMSVLANHLFYGYTITRWAYAEEPFRVVWAVRDDGRMLLFTYLKEQDVYAWSWADSPGNSGTDKFKCAASIPENGEDSVYVIVERTIPGVNSGNAVQYIERVHSRNMLTEGRADVTKAWFVDCASQYSGSPTTVVSGLDHLNGATVSILADGSVQPTRTVVNGQITLQRAASIVTVGLPYVAQMQTLPLAPDELLARVQGNRKKIASVTIRVADSRGLKIGPDFDSLISIKERTAPIPYGTAIPLYTGDERVIIDHRYVAADMVCIQQDNPLPCTILGIVPEVKIGDTPVQ